MKSAILMKGERYYTYLRKIFNVIDNVQIKYNWLITNCECYPSDENLNEIFSREYVWISGEQLTQIIEKNDMQFVWGVFSGFSKEISINDVLKYDLPFADGNGTFSKDDVKIQHPLADIEIVAFDSTFTLFMSKDEKLVDLFRRGFPLSEDLEDQNRRDNSEIFHVQELLKKELIKRGIKVNDKTLHLKYSIWNMLYSKRDKTVEDGDILNCINKLLNKMSQNNV